MRKAGGHPLLTFEDRADAGRRLAEGLASLRGEDVVVLGLPRGGVPVAAEVARALQAPLDVIVVRKVGVPWQPELAMGAVGEDGVRVVNEDVVRTAGVSQARWERVEAAERHELERRVRRFRGDRAREPLTGRTVIVVDDGIATGSTAQAACRVARASGAARVVLAVPVAPAGSIDAMRRAADEVVVLETPAHFHAVGQWYTDFSQTTDDEVVALLHASAVDEDVGIDTGGVRLTGRLTAPARTTGIVVFAHGSGSSRHSPRNRFVAEVLQRAGLATLLFDLLSPDEEADRANVFDVPLLGARLAEVTAWLRGRPEVRGLPVGFFGASTGAGAALWAAAEPDNDVAAIVSRGGRPDLAGERLEGVRAPTLLIVGGRDEQVLQLNRSAAARLRCEHRVEVVSGASHLFEEPGTLLTAADLACAWFTAHLAPGRTDARRG